MRGPELMGVRGGQIYSWDLLLDYTNVDLLSEYRFIFSLESGLGGNDFLQIDMPYVLHTGLSGNSPIDVTATYMAHASECTVFEDVVETPRRPAKLLYYSGSTYFVQFLDSSDTSQGFALSAQSIYSLFLNLNINGVGGGTPPFSPIQVSGMYLPVALQTVSKADTALNNVNTIVYDQNTVFSNLALAPAADLSKNSMIVSAEVSSVNKQLPDSEYEVILNVFNRQATATQTRYQFFFAAGSGNVGDAFSFTLWQPTSTTSAKVACQSLSKQYNTHTISELGSSEYSCYLKQTSSTQQQKQYMLIIEVKRAVQKGESLRFKAFVRNPSLAVLTSVLEVRRMYLYSNTVLERCQIVNTFQVKYATAVDTQTYARLAWGIGQGMQVAPGTALPIVRGDAVPTPAMHNYNGIQFLFALDRDSPSQYALELEFKLTTSEASGAGPSYALEGSILHDLPSWSQQQLVQCAFFNNEALGPLSLRKAVCRNVGQLKARQTYFFSFKMFFGYDAATADLHNDFSKLTIYAIYVDSSGMSQRITASPVLQTVNIMQNKKTVNNQAYYYAFTNHTPISSYTDDGTNTIIIPHTSTTGFLGLQPLGPKAQQKLIFALNLPAGSITTSLSNPLKDNAGAFILMNSNSISFTCSPDKSLTLITTPPGLTQPTSVSLLAEQVANKDASAGGIARLKIAGSHRGSLDQLFNGNLFAVRSACINSHSSLYSDESLLDFYFLFYDELDGPAPIMQSVFHVNAYTLNSPKPFNLRYSFVNWYGGASVNNDGMYVPCLLRIVGYLTADDLKVTSANGADLLALFFDNADVFYEDSDPSHINAPYNYSASCSSSVGALPTTCQAFDNVRGSPHQNYHNLKRIEVLFPSQQGVQPGSVASFELLLPIKPMVNTFNMNLFLASILYGSNYNRKICTGQKYMVIAGAYRLTGSNNLVDNKQFFDYNAQYNGNTAALVSGYKLAGVATINDYSIDLSQAKVGEIMNKVYLSARHTETSLVVGVNTLTSASPSNGAGFTFSCQWDFRTRLQNFQWDGALPSATKKCVSFYYNRDSLIDWRYGFFCPMDQGSQSTISSLITATDFQLPYSTGTTLPQYTSFAFSTYLGNLATLQYGSGTGIGLPNDIYSDLSAVQPPAIAKGHKAIKLIWSFKTTNPVQNGVKFRLTFNAALPFSAVGPQCQFNIACIHTCTVSGGSGPAATYLQFQITNCAAGCCPFTMDSLTHSSKKLEIYHFLNDAPVSVQTVDLQFKVQMYTSSNVLIDATPLSQGFPSYLSFDNTASQPSMLVSSPLSVSYRMKDALATIKLMFSLAGGRSLYVGEQIRINLGDMAGSSPTTLKNPKISCQILDPQQTNSLSFRWKMIDVSDLHAVLLETKEETSSDQGYKFTLFCQNFPLSPTNSNPVLTHVTAELLSSVANGNQVIQTSSVIPANVSTNFSTASVFTTAVVLTRNSFNTAGSKTTLTFSVKADTNGGQDQKVLLILFPHYYLPYLTEEASLICEIADKPVACFVETNHQLIVTNLPDDLITTAFKTTVYGVTLPSFAIAQRFFVAILEENLAQTMASTSTSERSREILQFGYVSDSLPDPNLPQLLEIKAFDLQNINVQQLNQFTLKLALPLQSLQAPERTQQLRIDFPKQWDDLLQLSQPSLYDAGLLAGFGSTGNPNNDLITNKSSSFSLSSGANAQTSAWVKDALFVSFNNSLLATASAPVGAQDYFFTIQNLLNPEQEICSLHKKWTIQLISDTAETNKVLFRSTPQLSQIPLYFFKKEQSRLLLVWSQSVYTVRKGPFFTRFTLTIEGLDQITPPYFTKPIKIALKDNTLFALEPEEPFAAPGSRQLSFFLRAKNSTPSGQYALAFSKVADHFGLYTSIPISNVNLIDDPLPLTTELSRYVLPKGGITLPIIISVIPLQSKSNIQQQQITFPYQNITLNATIVNGDNLGLSIVLGATNTTSRTFAAGQFSKTSFQIAASSLKSSVGQKTYLEFTVQGDYKNFFAPPDRVAIEVEQIFTSGLAFYTTLAQSTTASTTTTTATANSGGITLSQTWAAFRVQCVSQATIYYKAALLLEQTSSTSTTTTQSNTQLELNTVREEIISKALEFKSAQNTSPQSLEESDEDPYQTQYGLSFTSATSASVVNITNLLSGFEYKVWMICQNSYRQNSTNVLTQTFTTKSNGGQTYKLSFTFEQGLSFIQKLRLTCYLSAFFGIPPRSVITAEGIYCSNSTRQFDFTYTAPTDPQVLQNLEIVEDKLTTLYLLPDLRQQTDTVVTAIASQTTVGTYTFRIKKFIQAYKNYQFPEWGLAIGSIASKFPLIATLLPTLKEVSPIAKVTTALTRPSFDDSSFIEIYFNNHQVRVRNVQLMNSGFIYVGLGLDSKLQQGNDSVQLCQTTPSLLRSGLITINNLVKFGVQVQYFNRGSLKINEFQFKSLPDSQDFCLFIVGTSEFPGLFTYLTSVKTVKVKSLKVSQFVVSGYLLQFQCLLLSLLFLMLQI